jgi:polysaccharide biosynthesis protein PslG
VVTYASVHSVLRHRARRGLAAVVAAVSAVTILGADRTPAAAATPDPASVGVMFHGLWQLYSDSDREAVLDRLQGAGVTSVRLDLAWSMLQPDNGSSYYDWGVALVDRVIGQANAHGMKPLVMLWMPPAWANGGRGDRALPDDPADYARIAQWAARRWDGKVLGWEVWNEENSPSFMDGADPAAYTRLLRAAYPAFKAGSPRTPVVFGGVEYNDTDWLRRAYDAGAGGFFDVLAVHPYMGISNADPTLADDGTMWTLNHVRAVHSLMVRHGDGGKKIWFTEFGWSTHGNDSATPDFMLGVDEQTQARYLGAAVGYVRAHLPYVQRMYWYNERDLPYGGQQVQNYGLLHANLTPKPALSALAAVNAAGSAGADTGAPIGALPGAAATAATSARARPAVPAGTSR